MTVRFGSADTATQGAAAVSAVTVSGGYAARDDNYDAALLELSQPLPGYGGPNVNRIPFAGAAELEAAVGAGQSATATGFGVTSNGGTAVSPNMRAASLPLRDDSVCSSYYGSGAYSPALAVCAGGTGTAPANNPDTCQGDSGGPLVIESAGVRKLVGLTSRGDQCGQAGVPAVYTETSNPQICATLGGGAECTTAVAAGHAARGPGHAQALRAREQPALSQAHLQLPGARLRQGRQGPRRQRALLPPRARLPRQARAAHLPHGAAHQEGQDQGRLRRLHRQGHIAAGPLPPGRGGRRHGGQPVEGGAQALHGQEALTFHGPCWARTSDLRLVEAALSQLS